LRRLRQGGIDIEALRGEIIAGHAPARYDRRRTATRENRLHLRGRPCLLSTHAIQRMAAKTSVLGKKWGQYIETSLKGSHHDAT
jgi:hypothetical protein